MYAISCSCGLDENPPGFDDRKLKYFIGGELKHLYMQQLLCDEFEAEKEIVWNSPSSVQIIGHVDAVHKDTGIPIEFKTTESPKVTKEPYTYHIKLLKSYMSILGAAPYGKLQYLILGYPQVKDYFPEYTITLEAGEREKILEQLDKDASQKRG